MMLGTWEPRRLAREALDLVYPRRCALCEILGDDSPCKVCLSEMVPATERIRPGERDIAWWATLYRYEGRAAQAVRRLKYDRRTSLACSMGSLMSARFTEMKEEVDAVVPVPIHWTRRCARGFNQSELLCEGFADVRPDLLHRVRATRPQVGLTHDERLQNLHGAFQARSCVGLRILLVDDVLTSGQTARECARALKDAGALEVGFFAFAGESD